MSARERYRPWFSDEPEERWQRAQREADAAAGEDFRRTLHEDDFVLSIRLPRGYGLDLSQIAPTARLPWQWD
jgi:hypothetical protein